MDLSIFGTQVVQTGSNGPLSGGNNPLFGEVGSGALGNLNFLEAILGNLEAETEEIKAEASNQNLETDIENNESVKKEKVDLALLQLALLGQDAEKGLDEKLTDLKIEELVKTENNRTEQLTKLINHLTSGLPQEINSEASIEDLVSRLNKRLEKLESGLDAFRSGNFSDENAPFKLLIATGLNPAQLTNITDRIEDVESRLGRELTVEDLVAGVGNIIPAPGDDDHDFARVNSLAELIQKTQANAQERLDENAEKLQENDALIQDIALAHNIANNAAAQHSSPSSQATSNIRNFDIQALVNSIKPNKIAPIAAPAAGSNTAIHPTAPGDTTILPEDGLTPLPQALSNADFQELFGKTKNNAVDIKNSTAQLQATNLSANNAVPTVSALGDFFLPTQWSEAYLSQIALSDALGFDIQSGTPFTQTVQAAHLTSTSTQSAGQSHPATATVAAQITKSAQSGNTHNITLQLDPAELGRVEVRLEFGAENQVKAHLVVEKPETYQMLQRDAAALERALQDAGLETGSDALNYELAEENYGFGSDGRENGQTGTDNARHSTEEEEDIILTTMDWDVDPETGHVHYNIIA